MIRVEVKGPSLFPERFVVSRMGADDRRWYWDGGRWTCNPEKATYCHSAQGAGGLLATMVERRVSRYVADAVVALVTFQ